MSTIEKAYENAAAMDIVNEPKELGALDGVSYLYPVFYRFRLFDVPDQVKKVLRSAPAVNKAISLTRSEVLLE